MAILKVKDKDGNVTEIPAIVGPPGPKGSDYILTDTDKADIAGIVKDSLSEGLPFDDFEKILVYNEQELTEEQQMQARKNLGLYYTTSDFEAVNEVLLTDSALIEVEPKYLSDGQKCVVTIETENDMVTLEGTVTYYTNNAIGFSGWYIFNEPQASVRDTSSGIKVYQHGGGGMTFDVDTERFGLPCAVTLFKEITTAIPIPEEYIPDSIARKTTVYNELVLNSSDGSGKQFRITVNDAGALLATEIID